MDINVKNLNTTKQSRGKEIDGARISRVPKPHGTQFEDFAMSWYEITKIAWKPSFQRLVRTMLNRHLIPRFKGMDLKDITRRTLKSFRAELALLDGTKGSTISNTAINKIMQTMQFVMTDAAEEYGFDNPFVRLKRLRERKPVVMPLSLDEVFRFLKHVDKDFHNYYVVRFFTGMRTGEIDGLKWKYVDFTNKKILVREAWQRYQWVSPKTDSSVRDIDMSRIVIDALKKQKKVTGNGELVFRNSQDHPWDSDYIAKEIWFPTLKEARLAPRAQYQTRHTAASLWLASGENPEWVARQLGHANTEMLFFVYSKFIPNLTRRDGTAFKTFLNKRLQKYGRYKKRWTPARASLKKPGCSRKAR